MNGDDMRDLLKSAIPHQKPANVYCMRLDGRKHLSVWRVFWRQQNGTESSQSFLLDSVTESAIPMPIKRARQIINDLDQTKLFEDGEENNGTN